MTRPSLTVDTTTSNSITHDTTLYSISQSPIIESKRSLESIRTVVNDADNSKADLKVSEAQSTDSESVQQPVQQSTPHKPSIRLLFSQLDRKDVSMLLCPAILVAVISGALSPLMTIVLGDVFNAFSEFPISSSSPQSQRDALLRSVGISCIELVGIAFGSFLLGSVMSALWIATGERNVLNLRRRVYAAVTTRDIEWFDTKIGSDDNADEKSDGPVGVGGMMATFAKDTEDVRSATSMPVGTFIQNITSCIVCLGLAFSRSALLTVVILSGVPFIIIVQSIAQKRAGAAYVNERSSNATAATLSDRAISAIATVKAFNAQSDEHAEFSKVVDAIVKWGRYVVGVWGLSSAFIQFSTMTMFVQAFWFGAKLVRSGSLSPGAVTAVFYACLIATASLQRCLPPLMFIMKGKYSMVSLMSIIDLPTPPTVPNRSSKQSHAVLTPIIPMKSRLISSPNTPKQSLRRIRPSKCAGELALYDVEFAYPSRPEVPILKGASLFLPANDTTFIVGSSGSGKSTIAQLLTRMYYPQDGSLSLDDQDMAYLDEDWTRQHIALVSQTCILFDMTVHENVAMGVAGSASGRKPEEVTRDEVINACTMALMHEFIRDLPNGYDTKLGTGGASLSGGQKQRLAIARAILRDPTVLILDEATSALDVTSRLLVFEAIRASRAGKTTIVISHDLSQIQSTDFVYVLKNGEVSEQGYRNDLELDVDGEFYQMCSSQKATGGLPEKSPETPIEVRIQQELARDALLEEVDEKEDIEESFHVRAKHGSVGSILLQPSTLSNLVDVVKDISGVAERSSANTPSDLERRSSSRLSKRGSKVLSSTFPRRSSLGQRRSSLDYPAINTLPPAYTTTKKSRRSLQFVPLSPVYSTRHSSTPSFEDDEDVILEKFVLDQTGLEASKRRKGVIRSADRRAKWENIRLDDLKIESTESVDVKDSPKKSYSLLRLYREIYPTVPNKPWLIAALIICTCSGALTPTFSYVLSRLTFEVTVGAQDTNAINKFGGLALALTATDGIFFGLKFFMMECSGIGWLGHLRKKTYAVILAQDKKWFDRTENSPVKLIQKLMKDGNDAQNLISMVLGQFFLVTAMMSTGLIWALASCWQITLVGIGIAPIFAAAMSLQSNLVGRLERQNKADREDVAKNYYESIASIRAIRSMNFGSVFQQQFNKSLAKAHKSGLKGALIEGCTSGLSSGLVYLAEALLFIIGAILVSRGVTTFLQMLEALNLIVFSVTIGSQLMSFTRRVSSSANASRDFLDLMATSTETNESLGTLQPSINGDIRFRDVDFSYPERPDVPVLQSASLNLAKNECVAIVGASGSGKSTITSLLQRLYVPDAGSITIDGTALSAMDVRYLRQQVSVVSQNPHLFDASISQNIAYGSKFLSQNDIEEAAMKAHVHEFVASLPNGYETKVGENATLISGGQAQRLQIARALARNCKILILDECTSALDPANEAAVLETIRSASEGRTTLMITHKLHMMKICDRIIVIHQGAIAEEGTYDQLLERNGIFSQLARGGEWTSA